MNLAIQCEHVSHCCSRSTWRPFTQYRAIAIRFESSWVTSSLAGQTLMPGSLAHATRFLVCVPCACDPGACDPRKLLEFRCTEILRPFLDQNGCQTTTGQKKNISPQQLVKYNYWPSRRGIWLEVYKTSLTHTFLMLSFDHFRLIPRLGRCLRT